MTCSCGNQALYGYRRCPECMVGTPLAEWQRIERMRQYWWKNEAGNVKTKDS